MAMIPEASNACPGRAAPRLPRESPGQAVYPIRSSFAICSW